MANQDSANHSSGFHTPTARNQANGGYEIRRYETTKYCPGFRLPENFQVASPPNQSAQGNP
ncbi:MULTISPECIES: hypothetical protein [unclassified Eikenella]|uniref:hypothetical protein n=1 Tax=unclassified Eikenella TaxID=2639367 RepID=UPI000B1E65B4|nr:MULTISPECIES: hypothetical protein [unclassified Eikenella]